MKKNNVKVSVIMLCYNSEKYISLALDSILNQSFKEKYEVICVNDGSTDNTFGILNEYKKKYNNIVVVNKKNDKGKTTLKKGLSYVQGDYICVIDNDDYVSNEYLEKLYNAVVKNDSDISVCAFQRENIEKNEVYSREMIRAKRTIDISKDYGELLEVNTSLWNKMIKKDIFISLLDQKEFDFWMDMLSLGYMYASVKKVSFIPDILYFYQVRDGSGIKSINNQYLDNVYRTMVNIKKYYEKANPNMIEWLNSFVFLHIGISMIYRIYCNTSKKDFKKSYKENISYLNDNFSKWNNNSYVSLRYVLKHKGRNLKLFVCKLFYKAGLFKLFLFMYNLITSKLKLEIKW